MVHEVHDKLIPTPTLNLLCESQCLEISRIMLTSSILSFQMLLSFLCNVTREDFYFCYFFFCILARLTSKPGGWMLWAVPEPPWSCTVLCLAENCWLRCYAKVQCRCETALGGSASKAGKLFPSPVWPCVLNKDKTSSLGHIKGVEFLKIFCMSWIFF